MATKSVRVADVKNTIHKPKIIWVPSPSIKGEAVSVVVDHGYCRQLVENRRATAFAQFAGHIIGSVGYSLPDGRRGTDENPGILGTTALFRGLSRPMIDAGTDEKVHVFVSTPRHDYICPQERENLGLGPLRVDPPPNSVFTAFVLIDEAAVAARNAEISAAGGGEVVGFLIGWEWTLRSAREPNLPDDHEKRYVERVW